MVLEHFPKPGTKADTRMLKAEEENIEETSSDNSGETGDEEEAKTPLPATRPGISKCTSMKVQAAGNFEVGGTSKSALQKTNRQGVVAA